MPNAETAFLVEDGVPPPGPVFEPFAVAAGPMHTARHAEFCPCCTHRGAVAAALSRLFLRAARGDVPAFQRVHALCRTQRAHHAVSQALAEDVFLRARFRAEPAAG